MIRRLRFSLWYYLNPPWDSGVTPPEVVKFIHEHPPGRALDLGCGTGTNAITLARNGWKTTGIDFAPRAIAMAREKARKKGLRIEFVLGDVTRIDEALAPFDLVLDIGCLHGLTKTGQLRYLRSLRWLIADGGYYLLYTIVKPMGEESSIGLCLADLNDRMEGFQLLSRSDGLNLGTRPSAWLEFYKP